MNNDDRAKLEALPAFDDPHVQIVYRILCDTDLVPPPGEHWEGFLARRVAAAIASAQAASAEPVAPCAASCLAAGGGTQDERTNALREALSELLAVHTGPKLNDEGFSYRAVQKARAALAASPTPDEQRAQAAQEDVEATVERLKPLVLALTNAAFDCGAWDDESEPAEQYEVVVKRSEVARDAFYMALRTALAGRQQ